MTNISEISDGIIIIYALVALNFLFNKLKDFSCHAQNIVHRHLILKHVLNLIGVFFVIVLFTRNTPIRPPFLVLLTCLMYLLFMLMTRCDYRLLGVFLVLMIVMMYIEAEKSYRKKHESHDAAAITEMRLTKAQSIIQVLSVIVIIIGVIVYIGQRSREYADVWSWKTFWVGIRKCKGNGSPIEKPIAVDFMEGIQRLYKLIR